MLGAPERAKIAVTGAAWFPDGYRYRFVFPGFIQTIVNSWRYSSRSRERAMERRRAARQKSFLRGNIQFNQGRNSADCLIRDITMYGARLVCSDSITTPDVIDVYVPQKDHTFRAHVIWRHGQEIGVAFAQAATLSAAEQPHELDLAARVERLENELAVMKKMLKRLKTDTAGPDLDVA